MCWKCWFFLKFELFRHFFCISDGLGFEPNEIGAVMGSSSIPLLLLQFVLFPNLVRRFGAKKVSRWCLFYFVNAKQYIPYAKQYIPYAKQYIPYAKQYIPYAKQYIPLKMFDSINQDLSSFQIFVSWPLSRRNSAKTKLHSIISITL